MPSWALALMIVMQEVPAIAQAIDLANAPELTAAQMTQLVTAKNAAIAAYAAATAPAAALLKISM